VQVSNTTAGKNKTVDNRSKEEVYATWTVRELIGKEEALKYYNTGIKLPLLPRLRKNYKELKIRGTMV